MAQWVKALAAKSADRSLTPRPHMVEGKNQLSWKLSSDLHTCAMYAHMYTHTHIHTLKTRDIEQVTKLSTLMS